jgi:hypothetical protein
MRPARLLTLACVLCATAPAADAQLYKWIDATGGVNYGDWPPDGAKLQPMNHGTLSSVADRALVPAQAPGAARGAPRGPGPTRGAPNEVSASSARPSQADADGAVADAPYYGYGWRPAAVAEAERRVANPAVARPMLPIDPAIPDMPLRPRR